MRPLPRIVVSYWTQARFDKRACPGGVAFSLRVTLNFAIRQGHIERNPVRGVKFLPEGPGCMRVVSHEEQKSYLAAANPVLRDVAVLILETGMRPEEVFRGASVTRRALLASN